MNSSPTTPATTTSANSAIALRLELLGAPVPDHAARSDFDRETDRLVAPILARQRELTRRLANRPCAADRRIQAFLRALESEPDIRPEQARSIAAALGMATGAEAMIALFDIAGLSAEEARKLVVETAEAICDRMLP